MTNFIARFIAWLLVCAFCFLLASGAASFIGLEWQWAGGNPLERCVLLLLAAWIATKVNWSETSK
jgi:hypothetical protein